MAWFGLSRWNIDRAARPWGERQSILRFLESAPRSDATTPWPPDLPDAELLMMSGLQWAAGAMDGVGTHHIGRRKEEDPAAALWAAFVEVTKDTGADRVARLYQSAMKESMAGLADPLVAKASADKDLDRDRARRVARWLVRESADREAVKFGVVLLGLLGDGDDRPSLELLARHDEFTLFAVVALGKLHLLSWLDLWAIAKDVHGWGRVHVVERLAACGDPRVRRWLVREGFRNAVMDEYLALACAEGGDLAGELAAPTVDADLLDGAAGILSALSNTTWGGPAAGFEGYERGVDAVREFLRHAKKRVSSLEQLLAADCVRRFAENAKADWTPLVVHGWTDAVRAEIGAAGREVLALPEWETRVFDAMRDEDPARYHLASTAAAALGLDVWEAQFQRVWRAKDAAAESWWFITRTSDPARMNRVVALAEERLPLDTIAVGPAQELGMGPAWRAHQVLDLVVQELRTFPGCGWPLIRAALRSPVTRNRNMAVTALSKWDRASWPADAQALLETAARGEPAEKTRENIARLLRGEPLA
jgi:hypothetical protein